MHALAIVLAALSAAPARTVEGRVAYATASAAYLDAGAREGLVLGQTVRLLRGSTPAGTCVIQEVGDHFATCAGAGLRGGERFFAETAVAAAPAVAQLPPIPSEEEQAQVLAAAQAAPVAMVEFQGKPRGEAALARLPVAGADLGYAVWLANTDGANAQRLQIDVVVTGLEVVGGFRLYADARFMQWTQKSDALIPGSSTQLQVYDLELAQREPGRSWTAAVGRVLPWFVPGSTVFDGAQAGFRLGRVEVGAFGGLVPDPWTTAPTTSAWTAGAYATFEQPFGKTLLSGGLRAAVVENPSLQRHYEGELQVSFWAGAALTAGADVRFGGGDLTAPGYLDLARVYFSTRPWAPLAIGAGYSYWGLRIPDVALRAVWPGASHRADGSVGFDVAPWMTLSALGGWVDDLESGLSHSYVGGEILFPRVLAGLSVGYLKDLGWFDGQNAWAQINWRATLGTVLSARLAWLQAATGSGGNTSSDVGVTLTGTVGLLQWLALRYSVLVRLGLDAAQTSLPFGTASQLFLVGSY